MQAHAPRSQRAERKGPNATAASAYWTRFARTGDPNGPGIPSWPAFTSQNNTALHIGDTFDVREVPDLPAHRVMDAYINSLRGTR